MKDILDYMIEDRLNDLHTSIPAVIEEIDYQRGVCKVIIEGKRVIDGIEYPYPPLIEVKLDNKSFGSWTLQLPRKKGDKVWVGFSEISEDGSSNERFSLNEPYIIGSRENEYENNSEDIILKGNGTVIIIKGTGEIELTTGANKMIINSDITVNGNITQTGNMTVNGETTFEGSMQHNGELTQTGAVNITGNVSATTVSVGGIDFKGHTHSYIPGDKPQSNTGGAQ